MQGIARVAGTALLFAVALALTTVSSISASGAAQPLNAIQPAGDEAVPAFHKQAPKGDVPETMDPALFSLPIVQNAYALAARIKKTLYQEPCYCHCDRSQGHTSLLDCFASKHGSGCGTCVYEDLYSYEQVRKGKTAAQIREGIIKGEWKSLDATKYQHPLAAR
jgi:Protein of unknown function with PCYCGC motif